MGTLNASAVWAGITAVVWYAFGAVPLLMGVCEQLGLSTAQTSSWIFIIWFGGAICSLTLTLPTRQPIPVTWSIPGLVYLGTLADRFTLAELAGANLVTGVLILVLALAGLGARVMAWLPLPIIMGMFAGTMMDYVTRVVVVTVGDVVVGGATVAGYLVGRTVRSARMPPVGLAVVGGGAAVVMTGAAGPMTAVTWSLPAVAVPEMAFSPSAVVAVSLPLAVLSMGLGHAQGLGFLRAQGYDPPVDRVSVVTGVGSIVNALLGGHPANVARGGVAIMASPDAGPTEGRYWGVVLSAVLTIGLALAATPVASLLAVLPESFVYALAGLAIVGSLEDALTQSFGGELRFGALVAFVVALTPFSVFGITSAVWAIVAGMVAAFLVERDQLRHVWARVG